MLNALLLVQMQLVKTQNRLQLSSTGRAYTTESRGMLSCCSGEDLLSPTAARSRINRLYADFLFARCGKSLWPLPLEVRGAEDVASFDPCCRFCRVHNLTKSTKAGA